MGGESRKANKRRRNRRVDDLKNNRIARIKNLESLIKQKEKFQQLHKKNKRVQLKNDDESRKREGRRREKNDCFNFLP